MKQKLQSINSIRMKSFCVQSENSRPLVYINHLLLTRSLENILTKFNLEVYGLGGISWFAVYLEAPEHNGALRFNPGATPLPSTHPGE